jgi:hypothetical protein
LWLLLLQLLDISSIWVDNSNNSNNSHHNNHHNSSNKLQQMYMYLVEAMIVTLALQNL